jgi:hypothetical protein
LVASVDGGMYAFIWFLVLGAGFILFFFNLVFSLVC